MNHTGAVAVLDALGFKGIWKLVGRPVVRKLLATKQTTTHFVAETLIAPGTVMSQVKDITEQALGAGQQTKATSAKCDR